MVRTCIQDKVYLILHALSEEKQVFSQRLLSYYWHKQSLSPIRYEQAFPQKLQVVLD